MIFASAGYQVYVYDIEEKQIENAINGLRKQFDSMEKDGVLRGTLSAQEQFNSIKGKN